MSTASGGDVPPVWIRTYIHVEPVDSTSSEARRRLVGPDPPALPMIVTTGSQTAGRGQRTNRWYSDSGSLTATLALDPAEHGLTPALAPRVALAVAVAVIGPLQRLLGAIAMLQVRWPNDIECRGRKLGGILPEWIETPAGPRLLVGIGLNLTTDLDAAPADVRTMSTSLARLGGPELTPAEFLPILAASLRERLDELVQCPGTLSRAWSSVDGLNGVDVRVRLPGGEMVLGRALGINAEGALRVHTETGERTLLAGQVLRNAGG